MSLAYASSLSAACKASPITTLHARFEVFDEALDWVESTQELRCSRKGAAVSAGAPTSATLQVARHTSYRCEAVNNQHGTLPLRLNQPGRDQSAQSVMV